MSEAESVILAPFEKKEEEENYNYYQLKYHANNIDIPQVYRITCNTKFKIHDLDPTNPSVFFCGETEQ